MKSFRALFAPEIAKVIKANHGQPMAEIRRKLRKKWKQDIKCPANAYMASAWSREVKEQLRSHPDNQKPVAQLPLFNNMA